MAQAVRTRQRLGWTALMSSVRCQGTKFSCSWASSFLAPREINANSYYAAAYTLLGATLGYDAPKQDWQAWIDLRNLTNKRYANTVTPGYDDKGLDIARSTPGDGRGIYTGVSWSWR